MTYLFVKPRELHGGNVPDKFDDGPGDVRRQGVVGRQQRPEIWDNTDLARPSDLCEAGDPMVQPADAVQKRALLEQRAHEPNDLVGDGLRHRDSCTTPHRTAVFVPDTQGVGPIDWLLRRDGSITVSRLMLRGQIL